MICFGVKIFLVAVEISAHHAIGNCPLTHTNSTVEIAVPRVKHTFLLEKD